MARQDEQQGFTRQHLKREDFLIEVGTIGSGPLVVMLPGTGGSGIEQFEAMALVLSEAGFQAVAVNFRGVGDSGGLGRPLTLHDFADDVAAIIDAYGGPAHLVGRAFGNRVGRCVAANFPARVKSVSLIAAGGMYPPRRGRRPRNSTAEDPKLRIWTAAARAHLAAARATALDDWWSGGEAPLLVVQGLDDTTAVPENGRRLAHDFPHRVQLVEIADAGHQLLMENPEEVIGAVLRYLREREAQSSSVS